MVGIIKAAGTLAHGAAYHTDRTRKLFVPHTYYYGSSIDVSRGDYIVVFMNAASEQVNYVFQVPEDFVSFTTLHILCTPHITGTRTLNAYASWGAKDEAYAVHNEDKAALSLGSIDSANLNEADSTLVLAGLAKNDLVGVELTYHDDALYLYGIVFEYVSDE